MSWVLYGERLTDSYFSGSPAIYQPFNVLRNLKLKAIRSWFIYFNNPSFTSLGARIYNDNGAGAPSDLLYTSTKTWTAADITTYDYAAKELYFDFTNPVKLRAGVTYHFVPWVNGSALTSAAHLAWVKGYPDKNTSNGESAELANVGNNPFYLALIGAIYDGV